jgi:SAM-dependent methyltransferase
MLVGRIGSLAPLSRIFGFDRGTPVDRVYIEDFLAKHASDIRGHVLEVGDDGYSRRFGGGRITKQEILNIDPKDPLATIVGDLADPGTLPKNRFDCVILTQTLQLVFDVPSAIANIRRSLRPGGVLLMTVPAIGPLCADQWQDSFYWSFTENSVRRLLEEHFNPLETDILTYGNLYAATAFLHGAAVEELSRSKLQRVDPGYAITIAARAVAPPSRR